jgi:hypothetical protein
MGGILPGGDQVLVEILGFTCLRDHTQQQASDRQLDHINHIKGTKKSLF